MGKKDGNDSRGPWDIAEISVRHANGHIFHVLTFQEKIKWTQYLDPRQDRYLILMFDTDTDARVERFAYVFSGGSNGLVGVITNARGKVIDTTGVSHRGKNLNVALEPSELGRPAGYRWVAVTRWRMEGTKCRRTCVDVAPNKRAFLHDLTPPAIDPRTNQVVYSVDFPIDFTLQDSGFSGVRNWMVESRESSQPTWSVAAAGKGQGTMSPIFAAESDGRSYEFRIIAIDRQNNKCVTNPFPVHVPVDDASPMRVVYEGSWSQTGGQDDFLGTLHTSSQPGDAATLQFLGNRVSVLAPGGAGQFEVLLDGTSQGVVDLSAYQGQRKVVVFAWTGAYGLHDVTLEVLSGTVELDGFIAPAPFSPNQPPPKPCERTL